MTACITFLAICVFSCSKTDEIPVIPPTNEVTSDQLQDVLEPGWWGKAAGWSQAFRGPIIGEMQSGGGADIADINHNGIPDLLVMVVDNPENGNSFWYNIGWDMTMPEAAWPLAT